MALIAGVTGWSVASSGFIMGGSAIGILISDAAAAGFVGAVGGLIVALPLAAYVGYKVGTNVYRTVSNVGC